jgi:hypothetical protein
MALLRLASVETHQRVTLVDNGPLQKKAEGNPQNRPVTMRIAALWFPRERPI